MYDSIQALMLVLKEGKVEKTVISEAIKTLRLFRLVKIGRKFVRPRDYRELIDDVKVGNITYVFKLATRLVRGLTRHDIVLYSQGVLGLISMRKCQTSEERKIISEIYAPDQVSPIYLNERLLALPTSCSFWESRSVDFSVLRTLDEFLGGHEYDKQKLLEIPEIHGRLYDDFIEYIKELQRKYREIRDKLGDIENAIDKRPRTRADKIRALLRACPTIEQYYKNVRTRSPPPLP